LTVFLAVAATLDATWRTVIPFGGNTASSKFALAKTLLEQGQNGDVGATLRCD